MSATVSSRARCPCRTRRTAGCSAWNCSARRRARSSCRSSWHARRRDAGWWSGRLWRASPIRRRRARVDPAGTQGAGRVFTYSVSSIKMPAVVFGCTNATFGLEVEQHQGLTIVDFWATWCGPCHMVAPILDQLAGEYQGKLKVAKVDVDANQKTAMRFNVRSIPSILFFKDGRHVDTLVGAYPKPVFEQKIQQHLS